MVNKLHEILGERSLCPVSTFTTFETCTGILNSFGGTPLTMGYLDANFIAYKVAFVIFGYTFFGRFAIVKFLGERIQVPYKYQSRDHLPQSRIQS